MKLQYLFLPGFLWLCVAGIFFFIVPYSVPIILLFILVLSAALFFTIRLKYSQKTAISAALTVLLYMVVTSFLGFSYLNTVLILAIGALVSLLL
jgi:hypothetical protein